MDLSKQTAKVIEYSINPEDVAIATWKLKYWRPIHGELLTHRVFSRNASSSRAIPVKKLLSQVWSDPAGPIHWGANQPGMQARQELTGIRLWLAKKLFFAAGKTMCVFAYAMDKVGLHKQVANRILEPWQYMHVIATSTELENFFALRDHKDAQPEFQDLAKKMRDALRDSTPKRLEMGEWHLPFILDHERKEYSIEDLKKMSSARNARVSYLTHEGKVPAPEKDIGLHDSLVGSTPIHASPTEHIACALSGKPGKTMHKNFRGWYQYRHEIEDMVKTSNKKK